MPDESSDRPDEPAKNISRGVRNGGEHTVLPVESEGEPATRAEAIVDKLGEMYWQKAYGGQDAFECLVRTILSQNTSDKASQPAHDSLLARYGSVDGDTSGDADLTEALAAAEQDQLAETISSGGLYNQKSETIIRLAKRVVEEYGGGAGFDEFVKSGEYDEVRDALLDMKGVGPKTADCVLLFSGGAGGVFPVDTHVHRIMRRMGVAPADADHEEVREVIESPIPPVKSSSPLGQNTDENPKDLPDGGVPPEKCGFGHTTALQFGREYCTARKPACLAGPDACPLYNLCDRVGVDPVSGDVVDPAEAASGD